MPTSEMLSASTHPTAITHTVVILVGVAGTAYEDYTLAPLRRLGISAEQRQTSEANSPDAGNLRHATHAKDLATQTATPAAGCICSNHESGHRVAPYLYILRDY